MNVVIVRGQTFNVISQRRSMWLSVGKPSWVSVEPKVQRSHRQALVRKIEKALDRDPTFATFGGVVQIQFDRYQVAPVEEKS